MSKPFILLANDDGVNSKGLHVLWDALSELGEIVTVAPRFEQSAASHAITIRKPIKVEKLGDSTEFVLDEKGICYLYIR